MTTKKKHSSHNAIDEAVEEFDTYVGLAKEAAKKPLPRADVDIEYFLDLAASKTGKRIDLPTRNEVWELFKKSQGERIKNVEAAIKRYEKDDSESARVQLAWYEKELTRLREWKSK